MQIEQNLKESLIADVENILQLEISADEKEQLMRAFEVTIGCQYFAQSTANMLVSDGPYAHAIPANDRGIVVVGSGMNGSCLASVVEAMNGGVEVMSGPQVIIVSGHDLVSPTHPAPLMFEKRPNLVYTEHRSDCKRKGHDRPYKYHR